MVKFDPLQHLVDRIVIAAGRIHDYVQITFDGGVILSIYNPFTVVPESCHLDSVEGRRVIFAVQHGDTGVLEFESGILIRIDLSDEAAINPSLERMELLVPGLPPVVWN